MTTEELNKAVAKIAARYKKLNTKYIRQIAEQIKDIGELNAKSLNQIAEMVRMNAGIEEIIKELSQLTELTKKDVNDIMHRITEDEFMDPRYLPYYAEKTGLPEDQITPDIAKQYVGADAEERLRRTTLAIAAQTDDRLDNLSNTTAISEPYRAAIDRAVMVVTEGVTSYTEAMRDTVKEIGSAGMQVVYESGYHRRLDTAVRQNILDATGQIAQTSAIMVGEALKYNGMEISAHAMSAPDHEPVQGHVFLLDQFYNLQQNSPSVDIDGHTFEAIRRPISEWNCGHFAYPFDTRYSKRKYTDEELQKFIDDNKAGCTIGKKKYTLYETSQIMRRIECEIRKEKDKAVAAQAAGDERLRVDCQLRINHLSSMYKQVTDASGLTPRRERMTVEGFRKAKVHKDSEKVLTSSTEDGTIKAREMASGNRRSVHNNLTDKEKEHLLSEIDAIKADRSVFVFRDGVATSYSDEFDIITVSSNVFPSNDDSLHPRDLMSERATLAHEYYGHRANRGTNLPLGAWNDEFRASYMAAKNCPNLSDEDRRYLILDALSRASEAGVTIKNNKFIRGVLYGEEG